MKRKSTILITVAAVLICLSVVARDHISVVRLASREQNLRQAIVGYPVSSLLVGLAIYYALALVPGTLGKAVVFGWLFGLWRGALIADVALTAAALTTFALSRYVFREVVEARLHRFLSRLNKAIEKNGGFYLLTVRMLYAPFAVVNCAAGASRIRTTTFVWATALGMLPSTIVFVFFGSQVPTLHELVDHGAKRLLNPWLAIALVGVGLLPLGSRWLIHRIRRRLSLRTPLPNDKAS